jgi:hypothetical protein
MKLARPDIFHPRIVLAGSPRPGEGGDDAGLIAALQKRGLHARWVSWDDPDTLHADLVILRAAADGRMGEFLARAARVPNLLNAPDAIAWNSDERYLLDLNNAGIPVQPGSAGEIALIFLGGNQSHAFTVQQSVEADFELWDVGHAALHAAAQRLGIDTGELLYARAEVSGGPHGPRLAGLDLVAPSLGWRLLDPDTRDLQQRRFAVCVESALDRLGFGPLSHRRP